MFRELEISGFAISMFVILLVIFIIGLIYFFRNKYKNYNIDELIQSNKNALTTLSNRTKFPQLDVFKNSGSFLNFGLAASVGLALLAMSWTQYEKVYTVNLDDLKLDEEIEMDIPRTAEPPPPPPPPPPPVIEEVPDDVVIEAPVFKSDEVEPDDEVIAAPVEEKKAAPPPPPPPPKEEDNEILNFVEQMPRFPGCEDKATEEERKKCAEIALLTYIQKNLKYPAIAKENGIEGTCVISFVVDKTGAVTNVEIVRDIGAGCGEAAKTVVQAMNNLPQKWTPGRQNGRPVRVLYTLPVRFKLEG